MSTGTHYAGTIDPGPLSGRHDPNVLANMQMQILNARQNFQNALAYRHRFEFQDAAQLAQESLQAATPRLQPSPYAQAVGQLRF